MSGSMGGIKIVDAREEATATLDGNVLRLGCPGGIGHVTFQLPEAACLTVVIGIKNCEGLNVTIGETTRERHDFDVRQDAKTATFELEVPANQDVRIQWIDFYR